MSAVSMMSLMPTGMPCSGPRDRLGVAARAALGAAPAGSRYCQAPTCGLARVDARQAGVDESDERRSPARMRRTASAALSWWAEGKVIGVRPEHTSMLAHR